MHLALVIIYLYQDSPHTSRGSVLDQSVLSNAANGTLWGRGQKGRRKLGKVSVGHISPRPCAPTARREFSYPSIPVLTPSP